MKSIEQVKQALNSFGFVGERRALALAGFAFYGIVFIFLGLLLGLQPPELARWAPTFYGLGACYLVGFFAVAADWFWGRWFAVGLGSSGVSLVVWAVIMTRELPTTLVVFGLVHALIVVCLSGETMVKAYEGREDWRKRLGIDDEGVVRLRRSVTRAATSLPSLIVLALKPREEPGSEALALLAVVSIVGVAGLLRGRAWGLVAIASAGVAAVVAGVVSHGSLHVAFMDVVSDGAPLGVGSLCLFAGACLLASSASFARPVRRFLSL